MTFASDWLALREPFDRAARAPDLIDRLQTYPWSGRPLRVVDLGAGTGQFMRHLAPHLPRPQIWRLVDGDVSLLNQAEMLTRPEGVEAVETVPADLAGADLDRLVSGADLVVTTAFLDLVTHDWLTRLGECLAARHLPFYAALSVDGPQVWTPVDLADTDVLDAFDLDQRRDKGFGPALGIDAPAVASAVLTAHGFDVIHARSDWHIDARTPEMLAACLDFQATVAAERAVPGWRDWQARRQALIEKSAASLTVPHCDLLAIPA